MRPQGWSGESPHLRVLNLHHAGETPLAVEGDVLTGPGIRTWTASGRRLPLTLGAHSLTTDPLPQMNTVCFAGTNSHVSKKSYI